MKKLYPLALLTCLNAPMATQMPRSHMIYSSTQYHHSLIPISPTFIFDLSPQDFDIWTSKARISMFLLQSVCFIVSQREQIKKDRKATHSFLKYMIGDVAKHIKNCLDHQLRPWLNSDCKKGIRNERDLLRLLAIFDVFAPYDRDNVFCVEMLNKEVAGIKNDDGSFSSNKKGFHRTTLICKLSGHEINFCERYISSPTIKRKDNKAKKKSEKQIPPQNCSLKPDSFTENREENKSRINPEEIIYPSQNLCLIPPDKYQLTYLFLGTKSYDGSVYKPIMYKVVEKIREIVAIPQQKNIMVNMAYYFLLFKINKMTLLHCYKYCFFEDVKEIIYGSPVFDRGIGLAARLVILKNLWGNHRLGYDYFSPLWFEEQSKFLLIYKDSLQEILRKIEQLKRIRKSLD